MAYHINYNVSAKVEKKTVQKGNGICMHGKYFYVFFVGGFV
jgi:hypothetical protein